MLRQNLLPLLAACLLLGHPCLGTSQGEVSTADERQVVADADALVTEYCAEAASRDIVTFEEGRQEMTIEAEDSPVMKILTESDSPGEMRANARAALNAGTLIPIGFPLVITILLWIAYAICCWSACCKCCRCGKKERSCGRMTKIIFLIVFAVIAAGFCICTFLATSGFGKIDNGLVTTGCDGAKLMKDLMGNPSYDVSSGETGETGFLGLFPTMKLLFSVVDNLKPGSTFLTSIEGTLDQTNDLEKAVSLASKTVQLFAESMSAAENQRPIANGVDLEHRCLFCEKLAPLLTQVSTQIDEGVGKAMADARAEVKKQLNGPALDSLRSNIDEAVDPVRTFKQIATEYLAWFVSPDGLVQYAQYVQGQNSALFFLVLYASFVFFIIVIQSALVFFLWLFREKSAQAEAEGKNPYSRVACCCSCCTWCNAIWYGMNMMLVGGLMVVMAFVFNSLCTVMVEFDAEMAESMFKAAGVQMSRDTRMAVDLANSCLSVSSADNASVPRNLMDIVKVDVNGVERSIREMVVMQAIDPIEKQFAALNENLDSLGGQSGSLSENEEVKKLVTICRDVPISALILPDTDAVRSSYPDLTKSFETAPGLGTSMYCDNLTKEMGEKVGIKEGDNGITFPVPGIEAWFDGFKTLGTEYPGGVCAQGSLELISCNAASPFFAACEAANEFLKEKKNEMIVNAKFSCPLFKNPNGVGFCDPKNMQEVGGGWTSVCTNSNGVAEIENRNCNDFAEFEQYVKDFGDRLDNVFKYLDFTVAQTGDKISKGLADIVTRDVIKPIETLTDGFECTFLLNFWKGLIRGLCFEGARGFKLIANSYVIAAFFAIALSILMYILWRILQDNLDSWEAGKHSAQF